MSTVWKTPREQAVEMAKKMLESQPCPIAHLTDGKAVAQFLIEFIETYETWVETRNKI